MYGNGRNQKSGERVGEKFGGDDKKRTEKGKSSLCKGADSRIKALPEPKRPSGCASGRREKLYAGRGGKEDRNISEG